MKRVYRHGCYKCHRPSCARSHCPICTPCVSAARASFVPIGCNHCYCVDLIVQGRPHGKCCKCGDVMMRSHVRFGG